MFTCGTCGSFSIIFGQKQRVLYHLKSKSEFDKLLGSGPQWIIHFLIDVDLQVDPINL